MRDFQKPEPGETSYSVTWSFFDEAGVLRMPQAHVDRTGELSTGVKAIPPTDSDYGFWAWLCHERKHHRGWQTSDQIEALRSKFAQHQKWTRVRNRIRSLCGLNGH